ncbi:MAG: hypothetical protein VXY51_09690 [Pseudomonadota bacterium]|nr:hypothetical protein [Pseudomonadota bacterium]
MESLIWSYKPHLLTVGIIHTLLIGIVCHVHRAYGSSPWFMPGKLCQRLVYLLPICGIFGIITVLTGVVIIQKSPMTFILFNAALITVMFLELSIVLGRSYFRNLFNDDLPFSITMLVSFVLGINGGYFTLMFVVKLFRPLLI